MCMSLYACAHVNDCKCAHVCIYVRACGQISVHTHARVVMPMFVYRHIWVCTCKERKEELFWEKGEK